MNSKWLLLPTAIFVASTLSLPQAIGEQIHKSSTAKPAVKSESNEQQKAQEILSRLIASTSDPKSNNYIGSAPRFDPHPFGRPSSDNSPAKPANDRIATSSKPTSTANSSPQSPSTSQQPPAVRTANSDFQAYVEDSRRYNVKSGEVSNAAVAELQLLGPSVAPFLAKQLNSASNLVANVCATTLGKFGTVSIEPLMNVVRERGFSNNVVNALRQIGSDSLSPLFKMLESTKESERLTAANTIDSILPRYSSNANFDFVQNQTMVPSTTMVDEACKAVSQESSAKIRQFEASILGKIGPRRGVMDTLLRLAETDTEPSVRGTAITSIAEVLSEQSDKAAEPAVAKLVKMAKSDEFDGCRVAATRAIGQAQKDPDISVSALTALLEDSNNEVVGAAINALERFKTKASPALPALMKIVEQDSKPNHVSSAIQTIGQLGENAKPAIDLLIKQLSSNERSDARNALMALRNLGKAVDLKPYIPKLLPLLQNSEDSTRWEVITLLEGMGPNAISAKSAIEDCMKAHPAEESRLQHVLKRIDPNYVSK